MSVTEEKVGHVGDLQIGDTVRVHVDVWIRGDGRTEYDCVVKDKEGLGGTDHKVHLHRAHLVGDGIDATLYQSYYSDRQEMTCDDGHSD